MDCLKKSVVLLQLLLILPFILSSNMAKENNEFSGVQHRHTHCSDDSECPTHGLSAIHLTPANVEMSMAKQLSVTISLLVLLF